ncbi:MAG: ATP-binding protein, partial [Conexivisphaera sp.]
TKTRETAARIAREGRKFGVSLVIVSQRPQRLDQDVLSQMGSLAVGRLLNQRDRSFVQDSSEFLTEEMTGYLPDLNPGEAILVGQWVKLPAMVKVDRVEEKLVGMDVDAVGEWSSWGGPSEDTDEFIRR